MAKEAQPKIITKKHLARQEKEQIQNRYIVITAIAVLVIVLGLITFGILDQTVLRSNKAVAVVNDEKVTTTQFEKYVRFYRLQVVNQYNQTLQFSQSFGDNESLAQYFAQTLTSYQNQLADPETIGSQVLDQMVNDRLIRQEAKKMGITVSQAEIDTAFEEYFSFFQNGTPTPAPALELQPTSTLSPDQQMMLATLAPTADPNLMVSTPESMVAPTVEPTQLPTVDPATQPTQEPLPTPTVFTRDAYVTLSEEYFTSLKDIGFTAEDLKGLLEFSLYRSKLQEILLSDLAPVQDQVWARHILVTTEQEAIDIRQRYLDGENWASLAAQFSKDTSNASNGGDLGWFGPGAMVAEFETAAFATPVGSVSEPVQTQFGWHLIQVVGHEERPLTADKYQTLKEETFNEWLTSALEASKVEKRDLWKEVVPSEPNLQ